MCDCCLVFEYIKLLENAVAYSQTLSYPNDINMNVTVSWKVKSRENKQLNTYSLDRATAYFTLYC